MKFYVKLFKNSRIISVTNYDEVTVKYSKKAVGSVLYIVFKLNGREFMAMNGGPEFKFSLATSMSVDCKDQKEVNRLWKALTNGGKELPCGWLMDKYGLPWQIVPREYVKLAASGDKAKVINMNRAMFKMKKLDMKKLRKAFIEG